MRKISIILCLLIVFGLVASLGGCKIGEDKGDSSKLVIATFVDLHIDDPGTDDNPNIFHYAKKKYEEETGGVVQVKLYNHTQFLSKLVSLIGSGNSPDLVYLGSGHMPKFAAMELLQPVDEYIKIEDVNYPEAAKSFIWKEKGYALRVEQVQPYMIWYNKKIFVRNGVEDPYDLWKEGKWTWSEFEKIGKELTQDTNQDGAIDQWGFSTSGVYTPMWANGGDWYRINDKGEVDITWKEPAFYNGLKFMQEAAGSWWTPGAGDGYSSFASNGCAMVGYTFEFVWQFASDMESDDIGCVPWPTGPDFEENGGLYQAYCNLLGIGQGASNPQGAAKFAEFMTELEMEKYKGHLPFGNATAEKFLTEEHWEALSHARSNTRINPIGWGDWDAIRWFSPIYSDDADIVATLDSLEPLLRAEIDKTLAYVLPEVKEFKTPDVLSFEDGSMSYLTIDDCVGEAVIIDDSEAVVHGKKSLKLVSAEPGEALVRTAADKLQIPGYWTYTINFDWKVLGEAEPGMGADFRFTIRSENDITGETLSVGSVTFGGSEGETGSVNGTITLDTNLEKAILVFSGGEYGGSISIDNLEIIAD